jgi:Holliday junction resolvase YEN1
VLRESVAGAWDFVDVGSVDKGGVVLKGKARKKWRESEVEVLDLS